MSATPSEVEIAEEGPREGFQIEKGPIPTARKIELIDALSRTGLRSIQVVSFVNPKLVPGMADAEAVVAGTARTEGVSYRALWLNERGFERARACPGLDLKGTMSLSASETFLKRNQSRTIAQQIAASRRIVARYVELGLPLERATVMAAFGCNFEGDVPPARVVELIGTALDIAAEVGAPLQRVSLADTMAWATPSAVKRLLDAVWSKYPDLSMSLHLHDTRGMGIANAYAGLQMGVRHFDAAVAGLGGCPFAGHAGAAGNVCTEDLVFMCEEMGLSTGIGLEALIDCARLAEDVVGHPLPGSVMKGGTLSRLRAAAAAPA
ncbi:MAG: hydroxymethylglutaryl-CoA lyase [Hyphomicrobiaceae bacterium]